MSRNASGDVIDAAYKALIKKLHPDAGGNSEAAQELNWARAELSTEEGRLRWRSKKTKFREANRKDVPAQPDAMDRTIYPPLTPTQRCIVWLTVFAGATLILQGIVESYAGIFDRVQQFLNIQRLNSISIYLATIVAIPHASFAFLGMTGNVPKGQTDEWLISGCFGMLLLGLLPVSGILWLIAG